MKFSDTVIVISVDCEPWKLPLFRNTNPKLHYIQGILMTRVLALYHCGAFRFFTMRGLKALTLVTNADRILTRTLWTLLVIEGLARLAAVIYVNIGQQSQSARS